MKFLLSSCSFRNSQQKKYFKIYLVSSYLIFIRYYRYTLFSFWNLQSQKGQNEFLTRRQWICLFFFKAVVLGFFKSFIEFVTMLLVLCFLFFSHWQSTPVFLPWEFHGQRSLAGYIVHRVTKSWTSLGNWHFHYVGS